MPGNTRYHCSNGKTFGHNRLSSMKDKIKAWCVSFKPNTCCYLSNTYTQWKLTISIFHLIIYEAFIILFLHTFQREGESLLKVSCPKLWFLQFDRLSFLLLPPSHFWQARFWKLCTIWDVSSHLVCQTKLKRLQCKAFEICSIFDLGCCLVTLLCYNPTWTSHHTQRCTVR